MPQLTFTEEWLADYTRRTGKGVRDHAAKPQRKAPEAAKRRSKYNAKPTMLNGKRYASKHEAERAAQIRILWQGHEIAAFAEQVEFLLPGGIRYRADFVLLNRDGTFTVEDAKGVRTKDYIMKKKLMKEMGFEIREV